MKIWIQTCFYIMIREKIVTVPLKDEQNVKLN